MADLKKTIEILFEGNDQASRKAADVLAQIKAMEAQAKATSGGTDDLEKSLDRIGRTSPGISTVNAALVALGSSLAFKAFVDANVAVEKFETGLRAVQGSAADSGAQLSFVREMANRLGLDVGAAATSFVQLTAATQGTSLQGQQTRDIFEAVAKAMGALGKTSSETEGALKAIEQIVSKGKVSMEELRGQLGDRLPGAMQIAAHSMGATTAEFENLVKKGLSAEEFLPRFADELNKTFAGASFDGYQAQLNRLRNSVDDLLVQVGKAGLFESLTNGVKNATQVTSELGLSFGFWKSMYEASQRLIREGDFEQLGRDYEAAKRNAQLLAAEMEGKLNPSVAESTILLRKQSEALRAASLGDQTDAETARLLRQANEALKAGAELEAQFKRIGFDPKKTTDAIESLANDLVSITTNPRFNGEDFAQVFGAALKRATSEAGVIKLGEALATLFNDGKISAGAYQESLKKLSDAFDKVDGSGKKAKAAADEQAKSMAKQAAETKKAEENAQKFALEMEKLASNERIKFIEAKVTLNIAEVEAQTKRVEAAFESINTTITSSGDLLGDLFSNFKEFDGLSFRAEEILRKQIDSENAIRSQAVAQQKALIDAQVAQLRAQTRALEKGDSIIKIDGAGLQPHLEAFMWEILRTIQVRVNQDGLGMLLGV
jgi:tape measure domain-containing protein